jgi:hypothetical protein
MLVFMEDRGVIDYEGIKYRGCGSWSERMFESVVTRWFCHWGDMILEGLVARGIGS